MELLQEDLAYATDEMEKLRKASEEKTAALQKAELLSAEKDATISTLQEQVQPWGEPRWIPGESRVLEMLSFTSFVFLRAAFSTETEPHQASQLLRGRGMFPLSKCVCVCV